MANYTNVLAMATDGTGNVLNGTGYANGYRLSSYTGSIAQDTATDGYFVTGFIPYTIAQATERVPIYVRGIDLDLANLPQYLRLSLTIPGDTQWFGQITVTDMASIDQVSITKLGEDYYRISPNTNFFRSNGWNNKTLTHIRLGLPGSGAGIIVTINEPIEDNDSLPIYDDFIAENVAPKDVQNIIVRKSNGEKVGTIFLDSLRMPSTGNKLFSFLMLSDIHLVYSTGEEDFRRAATYAANDPDISFICISGDIGDQGVESELALYKTIISECCPNKPVHISAGNHEHYHSKSNAYLETYTGHPLCYSFTQGDHVFLMVGVSGGTANAIFQDGQLQWLYENLEANRNKHCWVFEHILLPECCGDVLSIYNYTKIGGTEGTVFKSLLKHYKNAMFVHGHTHMQFNMQKYGITANYDNNLGIHSIHVPSCAVPRNWSGSGNEMVTYNSGSEGYIVDVYEKGIHLRGRDMVKGEFLPIASYWLDTTLQTVEAGTYTDSTGTITT